MMFTVVVCWWLAKDHAPWWVYALAGVGLFVDEWREYRNRRRP